MCRRPTSTSLLSRCTCRDRKGLALMSWWPPRSHSNVGHHDIKAIPFGVSVSGCVTSLRHINARGWSVRWRPTRTDAMRDRSNPRRRERKDCRATFAPCEVARPASVRNPARTEAAGSSVTSAEAAIERSSPGRSRYTTQREGGLLQAITSPIGRPEARRRFRRGLRGPRSSRESGKTRRRRSCAWCRAGFSPSGSSAAA
jgi:hypothetical protein